MVILYTTESIITLQNDLIITVLFDQMKLFSARAAYYLPAIL